MPLLPPTSIPDNANGGVELGKGPFSDGKYVHNPIGDKHKLDTLNYFGCDLSDFKIVMRGR